MQTGLALCMCAKFAKSGDAAMRRCLNPTRIFQIPDESSLQLRHFETSSQAIGMEGTLTHMNCGCPGDKSSRSGVGAVQNPSQASEERSGTKIWTSCTLCSPDVGWRALQALATLNSQHPLYAGVMASLAVYDTFGQPRLQTPGTEDEKGLRPLQALLACTDSLR